MLSLVWQNFLQQILKFFVFLGLNILIFCRQNVFFQSKYQKRLMISTIKVMTYLFFCSFGSKIHVKVTKILKIWLEKFCEYPPRCESTIFNNLGAVSSWISRTEVFLTQHGIDQNCEESNSYPAKISASWFVPSGIVYSTIYFWSALRPSSHQSFLCTM